MAVTIKDVAREAKVSVGLVSMVINGREGVSKETCERVLAVIKRLGFKPNKAAASLRSGRKKIIGVITPDLSNHYFSEISRHIENIAYEAGYTVLFGSSDDNVKKLNEMVDTFIANGVGGLLITPCDGADQAVMKAYSLGLPVVLLNRDLPHIRHVGRVLLDNSKGVQMAIDHLIDGGRTRVEMISNAIVNSTLNCREHVYMSLMKSYGLEQVAHINYVTEDASVQELMPLLDQMVQRGVNALLIPRGHLALSVYKAIQGCALKIPEDIALIGFDGGEAYTITNPEISQICQSTYDTASYSFSMLCEMMDGSEGSDVLLEPTLKVGGSTAPASSEGRCREILIPGTLFYKQGGWVIDQQFLDTCGSSVMLAHGLGTPVDDASTNFAVSESGTYMLWVRTRNWIAPWSDQAAGLFSVEIDGKPLETVFGNGSSEWRWVKGGKVMLSSGQHRISVHDLTGFDARFDSIYLSREEDGHFKEPLDDMHYMREQFLGISDVPEDRGHFDFVVVGGGVAGMCAAIAAARTGLHVALVHDRDVLGGNNSSEVRVGLGGRLNIGKYPSLGYLLNEFGPSSKGNARPADIYEDEKKIKAILDEKNITLLLGYRVTSVTKSGQHITSIMATDVRRYTCIQIRGVLFADCTGDATLGVLAGADWHMGREARSAYGEPSAPEKEDGITLGASMQWYSEDGEQAVSFPDIDWGLALDETTAQKVRRGQWYWEVGMQDDQIEDAEKIRDYGMYVAYSNWNFLKNHASYKDEYEKSSLKWLSYVIGKRESRRLMGDVVLTENDLLEFKQYSDGCVSTSWYIDNHEPDPENAAKFKDPWLSRGCLRPLDFYPLPFRCLYSRNVENLFMAGRDISVSHIALGTTRVMRTCAMMGEVIGLAARVCYEHSVMPRAIYERYWEELDSLMKRGAGRTDVPYMQIYTLVDTTGARNEDC
ncbi:MAG: FAD-dependent oxidoreductase [Bacteroidales bacterium]|nr:FAD-dependent oxidoreductase [Bacteroidales bacterium]